MTLQLTRLITLNIFFPIWNLIKQGRDVNEHKDIIQDLPLTVYGSWNQIKLASPIPTACHKSLKRSRRLFKSFVTQLCDKLQILYMISSDVKWTHTNTLSCFLSAQDLQTIINVHRLNTPTHLATLKHKYSQKTNPILEVNACLIWLTKYASYLINVSGWINQNATIILLKLPSCVHLE